MEVFVYCQTFEHYLRAGAFYIKQFFIVIYGHLTVTYRIFPFFAEIYRQIYSQILAKNYWFVT